MSGDEGVKPLDTSAAEDVINKEKVSALEAQVAKYAQAEADRLAAIEAEKERTFEERLQKIEIEKAEMAKSFDEKLDKIKMRSSTVSQGSSDALTEEAYKANKEQYDTMYLKTILPTVFDQ